jgi:DNA-binding NarL/FixJ family response regulator
MSTDEPSPGVQLGTNGAVEHPQAWSLRAVAARTGISASELRSYMDTLGPRIDVPFGKVLSRDGKLRPVRRIDTRERDSEMRMMRAHGDSIRTIAKAMNVSVGTVHRVVKDVQ